MKDKIINYIRNYFKENKLDICCIGLSGGKDSNVVLSLMCEAIGANNVYGVTIPVNKMNDNDLNDIYFLKDKYNFNLLNFNLLEIYNLFNKEVNNLNLNINKESNINLQPRLRMSTLYYICSLLSFNLNKRCIVIGTSNKCEKYVGYCTKGGDTVFDLNPLGDLLVSEVINLGLELGLEPNLVYKTPSDGLSGLSDEEKLGVSYNDIEKYIKGEYIDNNKKDLIEKLHNSNKHKFIINEFKNE